MCLLAMFLLCSSMIYMYDRKPRKEFGMADLLHNKYLNVFPSRSK